MRNDPQQVVAQVPRPLDLFYCYAHEDHAVRKKLEVHLSSLEREGIISPWFDGRLLAGDRWNEVVKQYLDRADLIVLLVSADFLASKYIIEVELRSAIERERAGSARVIPVIVRPCDWKTTPLKDLLALPTDAKPVANWRSADEAWTNVAKGIREAAMAMLTLLSLAPNGVVSRERYLVSKRRFAAEVYAIELLERPVQIKRDTSGKVTVTIDRSDVQEYIISNEGKQAKVREFRLEENRQQVAHRDREIQAFLSGRGVAEMEFDPVNELGLKLRWASGGVLAFIHRAGDAPKERFVPFYFRDIPPCGWNIALGSAERWFDTNDKLEEGYHVNNELDAPENVILREFIEETLIVEGNPFDRPTLPQRRLRIIDGHGTRAIPQGHRFGDEHRQLRRDKRDLDILEKGGEEIAVMPVSTSCDLIVLRDGKERSTTNNVLVCFSLFDLGIEVVKVKEFEIGRDDYMLDGEIQPSGEAKKELVRMPMALISESYLRKVFSNINNWQYTRGIMPSIIVDKPPCEEKREIELFKFDVARRVEILNSGDATPWEEHRIEGWLREFGANFFVNSKPSAANPSRLFVPGAAKLLNLFFAQESGLSAASKVRRQRR